MGYFRVGENDLVLGFSLSNAASFAASKASVIKPVTSIFHVNQTAAIVTARLIVIAL